MEDHYVLIRAVHIGAVVLSGALFTVRAAALNGFSAPWVRALPLRIASWVIDSILLAGAITLTTIIHQYPFVDAWLTAKVLLLVVYIGLGAVALKPARAKVARLVCWAAAAAPVRLIVDRAPAPQDRGKIAAGVEPPAV